MWLQRLHSTNRFNLILITTFLFMAGYITQRISLTVFLNHAHYSLSESYSIATSYISLFSICCLTWGFLNKYFPAYEKITVVALLAVSAGLLLLTLPFRLLQLSGVSLLMMGGSLYFSFMTLTINKQFHSATERQQANHLYQIMFNFGALFGTLAIGFLSINHYSLIYQIGALTSLAGALLVMKSHSQKTIQPLSQKQSVFFLGIIIGIFLFTTSLLSLGNLTRIISMAGFFVGVSYILFLSYKEHNKHYLSLLLIIILCGFPYWLSVSILYSQFTVFLTQKVNNVILGIPLPPMAVLNIDAIANVIFGLGIYKIYKKYGIKAQNLFLISLILTATAFLFLIMPISHAAATGKINLIWPTLTMTFYATAEFLLLTTLVTQIGNFVPDKNRQGIFISMEYLASSACATLAFYFMHVSNNHLENKILLTPDLHLYSMMMAISLIACGIYLFCLKFKFIEVFNCSDFAQGVNPRARSRGRITILPLDNPPSRVPAASRGE